MCLAYCFWFEPHTSTALLPDSPYPAQNFYQTAAASSGSWGRPASVWPWASQVSVGTGRTQQTSPSPPEEAACCILCYTINTQALHDTDNNTGQRSWHTTPICNNNKLFVQGLVHGDYSKCTMHTYIHMHKHIHARTCACAHAHTHIQTHTHTHRVHTHCTQAPAHIRILYRLYKTQFILNLSRQQTETSGRGRPQHRTENMECLLFCIHPQNECR